jgi:hypothetical protein
MASARDVPEAIEPLKKTSFDELPDMSHLSDIVKFVRDRRCGGSHVDVSCTPPTLFGRPDRDEDASHGLSFAGTLQDLLQACSEAAVGTVFDLGGATVVGTVRPLQPWLVL